MLEIDGTHGEGGGQILRGSLALALVTGKAFRDNILPACQPPHALAPRTSSAQRLDQPN
jgi:RNA 3'-terminal phosphate cyclase